MALQTKTFSTGSFDRYGASNGYILDLVIAEESVDVLANTSEISYKLQLRSGPNNRFDWELTSKLSLNGSQIATKTEEKYLDYNSTWVLLSGNTTVQHENDGSMNLSFSATVTPYNGGTSYTPPGLTISGTMPLSGIARASTLSATAAYIEDAATIAVSRKSVLYTHSIKYQFGSLSGYIADAAGAISAAEKKITATTIVFPIPDEFYEQIPNDPSGICTLTCTTYSGNAQIGDPQTAAFLVTADPSRCGPSISGTAEDINNATLSLTGNKYAMVYGVSNALCIANANARKSASIKSVYINSKKVQQTPYTLTGVTSAEITFRAEDSRGYTSEYTVPGLSLVSYVPLSFSVSASRTDPTSGDAVLQIAGKWYNGSFGAETNSLTARYKAGGDWIPFVITQNGTSATAEIAISGLDYRYSHTLQVEISDLLSTIAKSTSISKGIPVFDWGENDFCFHVPVIFTATDGTEFSLDLVDGKLQIRRET